jgi:hypothetical protein
MTHFANAEVVDSLGDGIVLWTSDGGLYALEWFGEDQAPGGVSRSVK